MNEPVTLYAFLSGAVALGFFVCGLFFLRSWRGTRDELFLAFALAFGLLGLGQAILALANIPTEERGSIYLIRLLAFALIIVAILRKNRAGAYTLSRRSGFSM
jgi:hypothetical protein